MKKLTTTIFALSCVMFSIPAFSQLQISLSLLRSTATVSITQPYLVTDEGREGLFYYDAKDLSTPDNGGTVIVNGSKRFKRMYNVAIDGSWFGMKADCNGTSGTDNTAALMAAINSAKNGETVLIPKGSYYFKSSIALPLVSVKKVVLEIYGDIYFAKGSGFVIEGPNQNFKSYGLIAGTNSGASTEAAYAAYLGTGVYLKNAVNCHVEVNEIKDFKYGIHVSGDKSGGSAVGAQYNKVYFNSIHHNYIQIRVSTIGATDGSGNWNNGSFWYGGQLGRGIPRVTYGEGGWYGVVFTKEASSNAKYSMDGHIFHDVAFEGLQQAIKMDNAANNSFIGGRIESNGIRVGFDLDPQTCFENKFVGISFMDENQFVPGRLGSNTIITGTPVWIGDPSTKGLGGTEAITSIDPNKLLITTNKYTYTNFMVNKANDLVSRTGQYPTLQAMMYRIDGVVRSVPYKKTFFYAKTSTTESSITLPPNIGLVRVETNQAKVFKIDAGDLALYGEEFLVEYLTPQYPISFVRSDNSAELIAASQFPSAGTYRCLWTDGQYKISKMGEEYKMWTYVGALYTVADGIQTVFGNSTHNPSVVQLPAAAAWPGREITIKNVQAAKPIQVNGVSESDENIIQGKGAMTLKSDGTTWHIISYYKRSITY